MKHILVAIILLVAVSGCSHAKPHNASMAEARLAVKEALASNAPRYSPNELTLAQERLRQAEDEYSDKDYSDARRLSERATVEARYARARGDANLAEEKSLDAAHTNRAVHAG